MPALCVPQIKVFRTIWGAETQFSSDINILFNELHRLGFNGIEASLNDIHRISKNNDELFMEILTKNKLELIAICYTNWADFEPGSWEDLSVDEHINNLDKQLEQVMKYNPIHINIHGGQDNWTIEQHEKFFQEALVLQAKYPNVSSSHETHRGRSLFNPSITLHLISRFPNLRLTADFSHWLVVCERLLDHPSDMERMRKIISRVDHIHARVGTVQHAQVTDPLIDAPKETQLMQNWWQMIWTEQIKQGKTITTLTPEYGPIPYAISNDVDVWKLTNREMERQRKNYQEWINQNQDLKN
ncbi:unnamed protein product [Adineta steineri]|uniref:Uncharacterized protein n=1 Tax=Adineta steineri TaxID=433720 RepID=A0A814PZC2_9BILA|nr:unnamed protein product [Adineta steineri]CAF3673732.1 unnamed protein product [Adineta steineri]